MSTGKRIRDFRPSGLTQHRAPNAFERAQRAKALPHDTTPGRSAREWFAALRPRMLSSRPLLEVVNHPHLLVWDPRGRRKPVPVQVRRLGAPTFRNVIDENGRHV